MATKFGVQLKSTTAPGDGGAKETSRPGPRGGANLKPVSDLKAMFDKGQTDTAGTKAIRGFGADYNKKTTTTAATKTPLTATKSDGSVKNFSLSSVDQDAFKLLSKQLKDGGVESVVGDVDEAKPVVAKARVYEGGQTYKATIQTKEKSSSNSGQTEISKTTARSQLSSGLALLRIRPGSGKGEKSMSRGSSVEDDIPTFNKGKESESKLISKPNENKLNLKVSSVKPLNGDSGNGFKEKYIPGVPRGWKSNTEDPPKTSETSVISKVSLSSKTSGNNGTKTSSASTAFSKVTESSSSHSAFNVGNLKLPLGTRAGSPFNRQSSDDNSSGSSGISPRGVKSTQNKSGLTNTVSSRYSPRRDQVEDSLAGEKTVKTSSETTIASRFNQIASQSNTTKSQMDGRSSPVTVKTDINKNEKNKDIQLRAKSSLSSVTPNEKKKSAQEQLLEDRHKYTKNRNSGSLSSDSDKSARSPKVRGPEGKFKWMEKGRISYEEFKQQHRDSVKKENLRSSSTDSSSSLNRSDGQGIKARLERFASPEPQKGDQTGSRLQNTNTNNRRGAGETTIAPRGDIKKQTVISKRISPKKFEDIKKGFESGEKIREQSPQSGERKPKLEIKTSKPLLERRQSFENPECLARQRSIERVVVAPRETGKVLETIRSLNDLEAAVKAQHPIRRTQSLRKASVEDEEGSSGSLYEEVEQGMFYHDVHGVRLADDGQSNEGDLSSEADQIYEIISDVRGREGYSVRRNAVKKRRKFGDDDSLGRPESTDSKPETGIEADIDSDTDSSRSSGIYEPIDIDFDEGVSQSDSADPEFIRPPPLPKSNKKKKKKDDKHGSQKGLTAKFKKLYKGKNSDSESALKTAAAAGGTVQPSAGVFNKLGGKLKNLKKTKSADPNLESQYKDESKETYPVCESDSSELSTELESSHKSLSMERSDEDGNAAPPVPHRPPPLPPRDHNALQRVSSNSLGGGSDGRVSPPLPPRNRVSNNLDLNMVIPIAPGGTSASTGDLRKSGWLNPGKDSYLHSQQLRSNSANDLPYIDGSSSNDVDSPPARPPLSPGHRDYSTGRIHSGFQGVDSYICVDPPLLDDSYSLADEIQKELDRRPVSSAYIKPTDLSTVPEPKSYVPFDDMMKYRAPNEEDDMLYMDLSDDQVYGKLGSRYKSKLESESLYQFYNKDKISRASKRKAIYSLFDESDEEGEDERLYEDLTEIQEELQTREKEDQSPSKLSTLELFGKKGTVLRALWAEMPEVKASGVLDTISAQERKIQESMFEIITSEATYLKSLNVLINVFLMSAEFSSDMSDRCVLTRQERHNIFSNIGTIRDTSERFLADLESRWQKSVLLSNVCDLISSHATEHFECYVRYCSNQTFQDRMVTTLKKKADFSEALKRLESHPDCQGLPMISFLLLPMQRITRLPLLVDAICHRLDPISDKQRHSYALKAQDALSKVVKRCNEGAKKMQQTEQMCLIAQQLEFKIKEIPLISASRYLVKQGELTRVMGESTKLFGKGKAGKQSLYLFLFSDILLITKKRGNQYTVSDYAMRNALHVETVDNPEKMTRLLPNGVPSGCKNLFLLVMLENYEKKEMEMVFSCNSMSERARWLDAATPVKVSVDQERIYEEWDCPQVQCVKKYKAEEPDELSLEESDVINVYKKLDDGWYEGERLRDGERGWFPQNYTEEILNSHVRARNLRLRYRMLRASDENSR